MKRRKMKRSRRRRKRRRRRRRRRKRRRKRRRRKRRRRERRRRRRRRREKGGGGRGMVYTCLVNCYRGYRSTQESLRKLSLITHKGSGGQTTTNLPDIKMAPLVSREQTTSKCPSSFVTRNPFSSQIDRASLDTTVAAAAFFFPSPPPSPFFLFLTGL